MFRVAPRTSAVTLSAQARLRSTASSIAAKATVSAAAASSLAQDRRPTSAPGGAGGPSAPLTRAYDPELHGPETRGTFPHRVILSHLASSGPGPAAPTPPPELPTDGPPLSARRDGTAPSSSPSPLDRRDDDGANQGDGRRFSHDADDDRCPWTPSMRCRERRAEELRRAELVDLAQDLFDHSADAAADKGSIIRCLVPLRIRQLFATRSMMRAKPVTGSEEVTTTPGPGEPAGALEAARAAESKAMERVVSQLSPEARRYLLVAAATEEWYGTRRVGAELLRADSDADTRISASDYKAWVKKVFAERCGLSRREFLLTALNTAIPFVAFGFLDNSVMVLSGDAIDRTVGAALNLSAMAAAGLGGICSGTMGIQVHGLAERAIQSLGFEPPQLSHTQRQHPSFLRATHVGGSVGIFVGLSLGMAPLLLLPEPAPEEDVLASMSSAP